MKLARYDDEGGPRVGRIEEGRLFPLSPSVTLTEILEAGDPAGAVDDADVGASAVDLADVRLLAPIESQEVWAAGVTYRRSKKARMEESDAAASCYDLVYEAERPELFFKATPHRVAGPGAPLRIRRDSKWNVPEPELALVLDSRLRLVGFTAGNDMSSRDIEGENPLYLPQAKVHDACCGLGPWITLAETMPAPTAIGIRVTIARDGDTVFSGSTNAGEMVRTFDELAAWLGRDNSFPCGAFLLTGTGVVPEAGFTLHPGDVVHVTIDGIGTLTNPVIQG